MTMSQEYFQIKFGKLLTFQTEKAIVNTWRILSALTIEMKTCKNGLHMRISKYKGNYSESIVSVINSRALVTSLDSLLYIDIQNNAIK